MDRIKIDLNDWECAVCPIKTDNVDLAQAEKDLYIRMRCICGYDDNDITKYLNNEEEELSAEEYNNRERFMSCLCEQEEKAVMENGGVYYEDIEELV